MKFYVVCKETTLLRSKYYYVCLTLRDARLILDLQGPPYPCLYSFCEAARSFFPGMVDREIRRFEVLPVERPAKVAKASRVRPRRHRVDR